MVLLYIFLTIFQKKADGQILLEKVYYHLDVIEKDYFGLQFTDAFNVHVSSTVNILITAPPLMIDPL